MMDHYLDLESQEYTYIGNKSQLKGEFHFYGPTALASEIEGDISISEDSLLRLERNARFKGTISCHDIHIYGQVEGTVKASGKVTLFPTASFQGTMKAASLNIHPGAKVDMEGDTDD